MAGGNINSNKIVVMNLVFSAAALIVMNGLSFFISPYIVQTLGVEANGFVSLAKNFLNYALIITTALNSMAGRFVTIEIHKNNRDKAEIYYNSTLITNQVFAITFLVVAAIFIANFSRFVNVSAYMKVDVRLLFSLVFLNFIIGLSANVFQICYFAKNKLYLSSFRDLIGAFVRAITLAILFTAFSPRIYYVGIAVVANILFVIFYDYICKRSIAPELVFRMSKFRIKSVLEIMFAGFWNSINQLGSILNSGLDLLISNLFIGSQEMGVLALSKLMPQMIFMISAALSNSFSSKIAIHYAKEDKQGIDSSFKLAANALAIIMTIPIGIFLALGRDFFSLWQPTQDANRLNTLAIIILIPYAFTISLTIIFQIFMIENKLKYSSIINLIFGFVNIALVLIFIKFTNLGLYAVPLSSGMAFLVRNLFFDFPFASKLLKKKKRYLWKLSFKTAFAVTYIFIISRIITYFVNINNWITIILWISLLFIVNLYLNYIFFTNRGEKKRIIDIIKKRLYFIK